MMIPSGIDTARFDSGSCGDLRAELGLVGRPVVGTVTTFRPKKGYPMLLKSFAHVARARPEARLLIAGEEHWEAGPETLARELGVFDKTILLGKRSDMPRVYRTFDVFVLASRSEGMSNALLEAMAMKLPVVATAVGGNPTVLAGGRFGRLVEFGADDEMARLILDLLDSEEERRALGRAARRRVEEEYSAQGMVRQMERLYTALLGGRAAG
ncbi:MAG: glycosyltransferase family 1 protein [Candidatus Dadabacteria bacterium]|nr:MAG: glycosyltransferase family 1 protein [Candidatus Dadabacteria bacterium]